MEKVVVEVIVLFCVLGEEKHAHSAIVLQAGNVVVRNFQVFEQVV